MCVHELRWVMRLYMTFSNHDVFKCLTHKTPEAKVEEATQLHPAKPTPTPDTRPSIILADEPAALTTAPTGLEDEPAVPTTPLEAANNVDELKIMSIPTGLKSIHPAQQPLWGMFPQPWETSESATMPAAPARGGLIAA